MGPNQTYKLLHSKNHKQNEKTTHRMEENICKQCNSQGINVQNTHTAHMTQQQQKQTHKKTGRRSKQTDISPNKKYTWPTGMWKDDRHQY